MCGTVCVRTCSIDDTVYCIHVQNLVERKTILGEQELFKNAYALIAVRVYIYMCTCVSVVCVCGGWGHLKYKCESVCIYIMFVDCKRLLFFQCCYVHSFIFN